MMRHAPKMDAEEPNDCDLENAVEETEKDFSSVLHLLMTETTNYPSLFKILVCLERQLHENMPVENLLYKKKLSTRYGLVPYEDWTDYNSKELEDNRHQPPPKKEPSH